MASKDTSTLEPPNTATSPWAFTWPAVAAFTLHLVCMVGAWFCPPMLNSDSATGFLVWDHWAQGGAWNHMFIPDAANIARDSSVFQAWWSPGQYVITAPLQWLGLSLGHSVAVGGFLITAIGLLGYWRFMLHFGFSAATAGWAVLAIACNWTFTMTYGDYRGGEPALLGVLPWLILATQWTLAKPWRSWLLLPVLYWVGNMAKNTYIPIAAGLIAGFRAEYIWGRPIVTSAKVIEVGRWLGWMVLGHFLLWLTYLRLGTNPTAFGGGTFNSGLWLGAVEVLSFPLTSAISLGATLGRIFLFPGHPILQSLDQLWPLYTVLAIAGVVLEVALFRQEFARRKTYAWMLLGVLVSFTAFYFLIYYMRGGDGFEERFFRPIGILLIPALVEFARTYQRRWAAYVVTAALAFASLYGVASAANRARYIRSVANSGERHITQNVVSREAFQVLLALDRSLPRNSLLVVPSPEVALDLTHTRVMPTHAVMTPPKQLAAAQYHGRVGDLVVLVDEAMEGQGKAAALLNSFTDYPRDSWTIHRYGTWRFYHQGSFSAWPEPAAP